MAQRNPIAAKEEAKAMKSMYTVLNFEEDSVSDDSEEEEFIPTRRRSISPRRAAFDSPRPLARSRSSHSSKSVSFSVSPPLPPKDDQEDSYSSCSSSFEDSKNEVHEYLSALYAQMCIFCSLLLNVAPSRKHNIFAFCFMLFVMFYFLILPLVHIKSAFTDDVKTKIASQDAFFARTLLLIGKRLSDPSVAEVNGPLAFTLASGNQTQLDIAVTTIDQLLATYFPDSVTVEVVRTFSESTTRDEVRSLISSILFDANGKVLIVLASVDRLRSTAPLALQTLTDKDNALYKNTIFVTTIVDEDAFLTPLTRKECTATVERLLDAAWTSEGGLSEDQALPVISRLTTFNICLAPGTF